MLPGVLEEPAEQVAPRLLGRTLTHESCEGTVSVRLTEVEAYAGRVDPASHAFGGQTPRNRVMFGPAGRLYVYRSHGIHWCANVVTGQDGEASAVLLRAGRVVAGTELARRRRGGRTRESALARGPGCLGAALGLDHRLNGAELLTGGAVRLDPGDPPAPGAVRAGERVGVSVAADVRWRFWVVDEPSVSAYRRSPRAPRV